MFKRVVTGIGAFLLIAAPFSSVQAALLAKVEADVDGSGQKKMVELTGEKKMPGSNYYSDLWIMVKNAEGKMLTAWKANLDGGYYCLLEKMPVNAKAEQDNKKAKQKDIKEEAEKRFDKLLDSFTCFPVGKCLYLQKRSLPIYFDCTYRLFRYSSFVPKKTSAPM